MGQKEKATLSAAIAEVIDGYHCSCYDFDDTEWEAIEYTRDELAKLAASYADDEFWQMVREQVV